MTSRFLLATRVRVAVAVLVLCSASLVACGSDGTGAPIDFDAGRRDASVSTMRLDAGVHGQDGGDVIVSDAGAMCIASPERDPYPDRTTNDEFVEPADCARCPGAFTGTASLDAGTLPAGATTIDIAGASPDANRCSWWVVGGACGLTHGDLPTDPDGAGTFEARLPVFCGTNLIRIVCENAFGKRVLVRRVEGSSCSSRDLRVTIAWDDLGHDWELHLVRAGGRINSESDDCTWFTCMSPDGLEWGVAGVTNDNPRKDVDDVDEFGPENIYLERATPGRYDILVEHWGSGSPSTGTIDIAVREATVAHLTTTGFTAQHVWRVGSVSFPSGTFTPIDTDVDCSGAWQATTRGCDLPLP